MSERRRTFQEIFRALQGNISDAKRRAAEVVARAHDVRDRVQACRARRKGVSWTPEPIENFVRSGSNTVH